MAATNNLEVYNGVATLACTQTSLASGSTRESASQSNTTNKFFDYLVQVTFTLVSGSPTTTGPAVNIYANASVDGTLWPIIQLSSGAVKATSGTDNAIGAIGTVPNLKLVGSFGMQTTSSSGERTYRTQAFSVLAAYGNAGLPPGFSILVENSTGIALSASTATTAQLVQVNGIYTSSGN